MMQRCAITIFILFSLAGTGCVDLKGVNSFTVGCCHTLGSINSLSYGYADYCADSCYIYNNGGKELKDFLCNCTQARNYDTAIQQEFSTLAAYFAALAKLSGSSEIINAAPLGKAIAAGSYGRFKISAKESGIAGGVSAAVTEVLTAQYKSKHLAEILQKYGAGVDTAIGILALHLSNLEGEIKVLQTELQLKTVLLMHAATTDSERLSLFSLYKQKMEALNRVIAEYDSKQLLIQHTRDGHRQLLDNISQLKSKDLEKRLLSIAADMAYLSGK